MSPKSPKNLRLPDGLWDFQSTNYYRGDMPRWHGWAKDLAYRAKFAETAGLAAQEMEGAHDARFRESMERWQKVREAAMKDLLAPPPSVSSVPKVPETGWSLILKGLRLLVAGK